MGVLGPGDFRSDETPERQFEEFGHSKNPRTLAGSIPGGSPDFRKSRNSKNALIGPYIGPYLAALFCTVGCPNFGLPNFPELRSFAGMAGRSFRHGGIAGLEAHGNVPMDHWCITYKDLYSLAQGSKIGSKSGAK